MASAAQDLEKLFHEALALDPGERREFLTKQLEGSQLEEALALLKADESGDPNLLETGLPSLVRSVLNDGTLPDEIGSYRIEQMLGRGGMATVYLGSREDVGRRAAIKVLPNASLSPDSAARFRREKQVQAQLSHPSIATLYDADTLPDGTPYFVMEYVDGLPITEYCDQKRLSIEQRLQLFRQACIAVQEAHRHAIIHRDIKPSNILVRDHSETADPELKLLDFGIAKPIGEMADGPDLTQGRAGPMTPTYAAPEQHRGDPVGMFTDVYALGVLLYELVAGAPPFDLRGLSPSEAETRVGQGAPEPPSRVADRRTGKPYAKRRTKYEWADLDLLCSTAMAPRPLDRYASVEALLRDVDHLHKGEPLEAHVPSWTERARKFVSRHRVGVLLTTLAGLVIVAFLLTVMFQAVRLAEESRRAAQEARASEEVASFLSRLLEAAAPSRSLGDEVTVLQLLDRASADIDSNLQSDPEVRARLLDVMGSAYSQLGRYERAGELLGEALSLRAEVLGESHPETLQTRTRWASVKVEAGSPDAAEPILRNVLAAQTSLLGADAYPTLDTAYELATALFRLARTDEANDLFRDVLARRTRIHGADAEETIRARAQLAAGLRLSGNYEEAESLYLESLAHAPNHHPPDHPHVLDIKLNLGLLRVFSERFDEAEPLLKEAQVGYEKALGPRHDDTLRAHTLLALVFQNQRRFSEARTEFERILKIQRETLGDLHRETISTRYNLAGIHVEVGNFETAERLLQEVREAQEQTIPPDHHYVGLTYLGFGTLHRETGEYQQAQVEFEKSLELLEKFGGPSHPYVMQVLPEYLDLLRRMGDTERAAEVETRLADSQGGGAS